MQIRRPMRKAHLILSAALMLMLLAACGGSSSDSPNPTSNITASDLRVQFDRTVLGGYRDKELTIVNNGTKSGSIGLIQANLLDAPFSIIADQCSNSTLSPQKKCSVTIQFRPEVQGAFEDSFEIPSNAGGISVGVSGEAVEFNVSINQIDTSACPTVRLFVTVTDRNGPVRDLVLGDISVFENDVPQLINMFSFVKTPISVAMVLDHSGSIQPYIEAVKSAAEIFVEQLELNNNTDDAAIIKFASSVETIQGFTDDSNLLIGAINNNNYTGGTDKTRLYDAVGAAVDLTGVRNDRRAVLALSDGKDTGSIIYNLNGVIGHANAKGFPVFTIGLGSVNKDSLEILADRTGGEYFAAPDPSLLHSVYESIAEILSNQYVIEYESSSLGGGLIDVDVEIDQNGRKGYDSKTVTGCP